MPWLKDVNPHANDALVTFYDEGHKYIYEPTGARVRKSMTGVLKPLFDTFDGTAIATKNFAKWSRDETSKYWGLCNHLTHVVGLDKPAAAAEIVKLWNKIGEMAADEGTAMHHTLELYIQGELPPPSADAPPPMAVAAYLGMMEWFYPEMELRPWRCEFSVVLVVDDVPVVSGQIDLVMKDKNGRYWLFDWKHTNPKKKGLLGKRKQSFFPPEKANGVFAEWDATDYNKYSAQILGYRYILEHGGYAMDIAGCFIVQMHEDLDKANVVEPAEVEDEVNAMMQAEIDAAREEAAAKSSTVDAVLADLSDAE